MLALALSLLFGFVAFAAVAEIQASVAKGVTRGRAIQAELAAGRRVRRFIPVAAPRPQWQRSLRAAA